jgi:hypothetical protein
MAYSSFNGYLLLYITSLTHTLLFLAQTIVLGAAYVGPMDDLGVFNRALNDTEVKDLFELKKGISELYR